jgi:hypothetical protein
VDEEQIDAVLQRMADARGHLSRSPVLHSPREHGLHYEDVTFPSFDGVPLEGWFIPADGSDKVIIVNHPTGFTRSGLPSHLDPWRSAWAASGNDVEVDFVPDLKILHDAGYNVPTYDLRTMGTAARPTVVSPPAVSTSRVTSSAHCSTSAGARTPRT